MDVQNSPLESRLTTRLSLNGFESLHFPLTFVSFMHILQVHNSCFYLLFVSLALCLLTNHQFWCRNNLKMVILYQPCLCVFIPFCTTRGSNCLSPCISAPQLHHLQHWAGLLSKIKICFNLDKFSCNFIGQQLKAASSKIIPEFTSKKPFIHCRHNKMPLFAFFTTPALSEYLSH